MIKNFPLHRMIKQLVQEGKISHKDGEIFNLFEDLPFNPTLEEKKDCLSKIKSGNQKESEIYDNMWDARRKIMGTTKNVEIYFKSALFDLNITEFNPIKKRMLEILYTFIITESLKVLPKIKKKPQQNRP